MLKVKAPWGPESTYRIFLSRSISFVNEYIDGGDGDAIKCLVYTTHKNRIGIAFF